MTAIKLLHDILMHSTITAGYSRLAVMFTAWPVGCNLIAAGWKWCLLLATTVGDTVAGSPIHHHSTKTGSPATWILQEPMEQTQQLPKNFKTNIFQNIQLFPSKIDQIWMTYEAEIFLIRKMSFRQHP